MIVYTQNKSYPLWVEGRTLFFPSIKERKAARDLYMAQGFNLVKPK